MANPFVVGLASNFEQALRMMEAALADCPDRLWATDLWPDEAPTAPTPHGGLHGSAPWFLGYHALNTLDYDLAAELEPWQPPEPFDDHTWSSPNRVFTKPELVGYVAHCRYRVRGTLDVLTAVKAARALPVAHRHQPPDVRHARRGPPAARGGARRPDPPVPDRRRRASPCAARRSGLRRLSRRRAGW